MRLIGLWYGSIDTRRAVAALGAWLTGFFTTGDRRRAALERVVSSRFGASAVMATGSGRSAITLALRGSGIGAGDEVIVSAYSCLAVPTGVIAAGATPVYVDIDASTLNCGVDAVIAAITPRTRAVIVQHTLGRIAPVREIRDAVRSRGIAVVEDCALSVGSYSAGRLAGSEGDAAIFSMELSKSASCGWGGILVAHDARIAARAREIYDALPEPGVAAETRDIWQTAISAWSHLPGVFPRIGKYLLHLGFESGIFRRSTPKGEYEGEVAPGFLQKLGKARAALAAMQWRDLDVIGAACERNARELRAVLQETGLPLVGAPGAGDTAVSPRVSFLVDDRDAAIDFFWTRGVELGAWFDGPMSPVPASPRFNYMPGHYPNAEAVSARVVNVPCFSRLTRRDLDHVITTIRNYAASLRPQTT